MLRCSCTDDEGQLARQVSSQDEKRDAPLLSLTAVEHRRSVDRLTSHDGGGKWRRSVHPPVTNDRFQIASTPAVLMNFDHDSLVRSPRPTSRGSFERPS